jgi:hypothetical protein
VIKVGHECARAGPSPSNAIIHPTDGTPVICGYVDSTDRTVRVWSGAGTFAMLAYANVFLGCLALFLEMVELAPVWPEEQTEAL